MILRTRILAALASRTIVHKKAAALSLHFHETLVLTYWIWWFIYATCMHAFCFKTSGKYSGELSKCSKTTGWRKNPYKQCAMTVAEYLDEIACSLWIVLQTEDESNWLQHALLMNKHTCSHVLDVMIQIYTACVPHKLAYCVVYVGWFSHRISLHRIFVKIHYFSKSPVWLSSSLTSSNKTLQYSPQMKASDYVH